ncbi:hypothetical protein AbraIFM66951_002931 [Aspergillus brasiliensis]|nr:hypothetical protein AbraIFM66951_002931 [Aspergillus brasiliensis]
MLLLITGITGEFGQRLAGEALARGMSVQGLGRSPGKLRPRIFVSLESFVQSSSYNDISALHTAVKRVDAIACVYTTDPVLYLKDGLCLLRAAEAAEDWTNVSYADFELYDSILAFVGHAAMASTIRPAYFINGTFAEWTMRTRREQTG